MQRPTSSVPPAAETNGINQEYTFDELLLLEVETVNCGFLVADGELVDEIGSV